MADLNKPDQPKAPASEGQREGQRPRHEVINPDTGERNDAPDGSTRPAAPAAPKP